MESMEMFSEILRDFNHSDLISMDVEMPGIKLSVKRESAPAGLTQESSSRNPENRNPALSSSPLAKPADTAGSAAASASEDTETGRQAGGGNSAADAAPGQTADAESADSSVKAETPQNQAETILCPLVGVFYSASAPDADPFVTEGQHVKEGEVMCIIEAMKSMNELKAPYNLTVKKVCIQNGEMAEFHQVLFEVEKC